MATIQDVKAWLTVGGVSHVVQSIQSGWSYTLCQALWSLSPDEKDPTHKRRVCQKCRKNLSKATVKQ